MHFSIQPSLVEDGIICCTLRRRLRSRERPYAALHSDKNATSVAARGETRGLLHKISLISITVIVAAEKTKRRRKEEGLGRKRRRRRSKRPKTLSSLRCYYTKISNFFFFFFFSFCGCIQVTPAKILWSVLDPW